MTPSLTFLLGYVIGTIQTIAVVYLTWRLFGKRGA